MLEIGCQSLSIANGYWTFVFGCFSMQKRTRRRAEFLIVKMRLGNRINKAFYREL